MIEVSKIYGYGNKKFDDGNGSKGMEGTFGNIDNRLVIFCRGSDANFYDWERNIESWSNKVGYHSGFYQVARNFSDSEKSGELIKAISNNDEIIIAGHSQGCGFIISFVWQNRELLKGKKISIVLFGCPNIFTKKARKRFIEYFGSNIKVIWSFRNFWDLVNTLPPWLCCFKEKILKSKFRLPIARHLNYKEDVKYLKIYV